MPTKKTTKATLPDKLPKYVVTRPTDQLDTFTSPRPGRPFEIVFSTEEFTCLCPLTGRPGTLIGLAGQGWHAFGAAAGGE